MSEDVLAHPGRFAALHKVQFHFPSNAIVELLPSCVDKGGVTFFVPTSRTVNRVPKMGVERSSGPVLVIVRL